MWFLILVGACALVVTVVFLVVAEALVPSGSVPAGRRLGRQVHAARLRSGGDVAVKVQRPGIRAVAERANGHAPANHR